MKVYCVRHKQPQITLKIFNSREKAEDYIHKIVMDDKHGEYEDNPTKG